MWYRVKVSRIAQSGVELKSLDYGHLAQAPHDQDGLLLHRLPPGLASTLPCLAVRCHLARLRAATDRGWDKLAMQMIKSCLEGVEQHSCMVVEQDEAGGSVGIIITLEREGTFSTVNQKLVEVGCAVSSLFGSGDESDAGVGPEGDSGMVNDWDPLEESNSTINNFMAGGKLSKKYA